MVKAAIADTVAGIDLTRDDLRSLAAARIELEGNGDRPFGLYLFGSAEPEAELARAVERRVFDLEYRNTPAVMDYEYTAYEPCSIFTCILDHRRAVPVAACRLIHPGGLGWKTIDDLGRFWNIPGPIALQGTGIRIEPSRLWDCATLAVEPEYRRWPIVQAIMGSLGIVAELADIEVLVAMIDCRVLRIAQALCGRPWKTLDGFAPRRYLDSAATLPVWLSVEEVKQRLSARGDDAYRALFDPAFFEPEVATIDLDSASKVLARSGSPRVMYERLAV